MTFRGNLLLYSLWYELHPFENLRRKGHHCHGLTHLSWAERKIFYRVLGKKFCGEIGIELDLTRERVRQIKEKAIKKLKHSSRSSILKTYLG